MRLLLALVGTAALVSIGWVCWRATEETRDWREFVALGTKAKPSEAENTRFRDLARRRFPDQGAAWPVGITILNGPGERRRILAAFISQGEGRRNARLLVLDAEGRRRSSAAIPVGPCGLDCRPAPERGPWAFDVEALTPVVRTPWRYDLVDDRPLLISRGDPEDEE